MSTPPLHARFDRRLSTSDPSLASVVGFPVLLLALLVVVSYPLLAATVLFGTAVGTIVVQIGLSALVRRTSDAPRAFTVPGVGTVTVRLTLT
ncbi:hypothetical protein BRC91_05215 [Halobacteriales archaeon QS_4_62_28]|nr:MAG: hypothetical protein BRC91_05215 [Halobacteriales archaeon QS_4_62_28]